MILRTGIGYDVHRFAENRPLKLGGIEIPFALGLSGHSDADVLLHAIADAILGATALGDIGQHFPPSDQTIEGIDSARILETASQLARQAGFLISAIDSTVIAEQPRLLPHIDRMRARIAEIIDIEISCVSVKATTNEGMGFIGRGEGIAALAMATLISSDHNPP
jgi:2-C-methyl-D-erythritol 2,4-cyclodiphosphate synthase